MARTAQVRSKKAEPRAGTPSAGITREDTASRTMRWLVVPGLMLLSAIILTPAYAPVYAYPLAWFGLIPWLIGLRLARSGYEAFFFSWLAGTVFFVANMWWLANVTVPGMIALMAYLGIYWGIAALVLRGSGVFDWRGKWSVTKGIFWIACVLTALEFVRGNFLTGLPWLYLSHTQTPALPLCQIADMLGAYGVSFWIFLLNGLLAFALLRRTQRDQVLPAGIFVALLTLGLVAYGSWRIGQTAPRPGPKIMVVQPNYPQDNSGDKGASIEQIIQFHLNATTQGLREHPDADLVAWSETMMPELNVESDEAWRWFYEKRQRNPENYLGLLEATRFALADLTRRYDVHLITGGVAFEPVRQEGRVAGARRYNSAYYISRKGILSADRFDKIHLVPFGEFLPFKESMPWLFDLFLAMSPYTEDYTVEAGTELVVFQIDSRDDSQKQWRVVTPICFEDIDSRLVARMFRPRAGEAGKRADLIVNLTNDGWFKANQMPQHLQVATFRSIENRVPTARSVNTGISGFIDSVGRTQRLIPAGVEGVSTMQVQLDDRLTLYTRFGDWFAWLCCATVLAGLFMIRLGRRRRKENESPASTAGSSEQRKGGP